MNQPAKKNRAKSTPKVALHNRQLIWLDGNIPITAESFTSLNIKLFQVQPPRCRLPLTLPSPLPKSWNKLHRRLFAFDPTPLYQKLNQSNTLNPFLRSPKLSISHLFENHNNLCACGCLLPIPKGRRRWATPDCAKLGTLITAILRGFTPKTISKLREKFIGGYFCEICGLLGNRARGRKSERITIELDHKYPVKFGGGGCWLSNYQLKCKACHRKKTNRDFGFSRKKSPPNTE